MKSIWKGTLSFGLVNIPINVYSAVQAHSLGFRMLCGKCNTPLSYERWCRKCNKEVPWTDAIKGLEVKKGTYKVMTKEEIDKLRPEKTDFIQVVEFVDADQVQPIYFNNHYYSAPTKKGDKSYFLFKQALGQANKVGIGEFVMRDKQYICAISPYKDTLLITTLNYGYEIRDVEKIVALKKAPRISPAELRLAKQLINQMTVKKFDITKFKDSFAQELKKALKKRKTVKPKALKKKKVVKKIKEPSKTLVSTLRASIERPVARAKTRR